MARRLYWVFVVALLVASGWILYLAIRPTPTGPVSLRVSAWMGDQRLDLGTETYANPGGDGEFAIRDFQFFLSNLRLVGEDAEYREPDSYHLVRFDSEDGVYVVELPDVPRRAYTHLQFGIGVDSAANASYAPVGDLDPNGRMAWGWEIGYKFVLVEGSLSAAGTRVPLVYHVGFDENYRNVSIPLADSILSRENAIIEVCVDLLGMFDGGHVVDMSHLSNVTFERSDSRLLADNYAAMASACPPPVVRS